MIRRLAAERREFLVISTPVSSLFDMDCPARCQTAPSLGRGDYHQFFAERGPPNERGLPAEHSHDVQTPYTQKGLTFSRRFSRDGVSPYDEVQWESARH